jgi:hypothetical protein
MRNSRKGQPEHSKHNDYFVLENPPNADKYICLFLGLFVIQGEIYIYTTDQLMLQMSGAISI